MNDRIEPTSKQKQKIFESLTHRNAIRGGGVPNIDIHKEYKKCVDGLRCINYNDLLKPYISRIKKTLPKSTGGIMVLKNDIMARQMAQDEVKHIFGITPPTYIDNNTVKYNS